MQSRHDGSIKTVSRTLLDPAAWIVDQIGLDRPGNREIQMDLFHDYRTNVPLYPTSNFLPQVSTANVDRVGQQRLHLSTGGLRTYARDLKNLETHLLDTGHFALETHVGRDRQPDSTVPDETEAVELTGQAPLRGMFAGCQSVRLIHT
jgi:hypothetical protein